MAVSLFKSTPIASRGTMNYAGEITGLGVALKFSRQKKKKRLSK